MTNKNQNRKNDAWAAIRGFVYQVDLSIGEWLNLTDNQHLKLECTEDIDIIESINQSNNNRQEFKQAIQVKYREKKSHSGYRENSDIKLYTNSLLIAILNFWELKKIYKGELKLRYTTNAVPVLEAKYKNEELYMPGIEIWNKLYDNEVVVNEQHTLKLLRNYLTEITTDNKVISHTSWGDFSSKLRNYTDDELKLFIKSIRISYSTTNFDSISNEIIENIKK